MRRSFFFFLVAFAPVLWVAPSSDTVEDFSVDFFRRRTRTMKRHLFFLWLAFTPAPPIQ